MATPEVFFDTSAYVPFVSRGRTERERTEHEAIDRFVRDWLQSGGRLVTTNLVIVETHQVLLVRHWRGVGLTFLRSLPWPGADVVYSTPDLEARALREWIERFDDQDFSLTDAVSFTVMRDRGIRQALARDRHFAVAGFELVPPVPPSPRGRR